MRYRTFAHCMAVLCLLATVLPLDTSAQSRVRGRVLTETTQEPVERANLLFRTEEQTQGTSTDSTGRFQISLAPGEYTVEVSAIGYHGARRTVTVRRGQTTTVEFVLSPREYSLNEIVVEDQRFDTERTVTTVQRVNAAAIETQDASDVSELAELVPATHVQTNSRGQTILYFRNAADRQVGQFFDGALLNIPWDNRVNISLIPATVVEEITVTKGAPSIRYGANVLGGAINLQSRTLDSPGQRTELQGALGTAEQRRASLTHLGRTDRWDYTAALQYASRGDQPLPQGANLEFNQPLDDRRVNTDRELLSGFGRASYRLQGGGRLAFSLLHVDAEQGVAPEGNKDPANGDVRFWRYPLWQKSTAIVSGQVPVGTSTSLRGAAWGSRFARDINDYDSINYQELLTIQEGRDLTGGIRLMGTQDLPLGTLTLAFNGLTSRHNKTEVYVTEQPPTDSTSTFRQHIFSTGLEYEGDVHSRVGVSAGLSFDGTATPETGEFPSRAPIYTWGLNTGARVELSDRWALRGALGRKSRFPTMRELFSGALGKFTPNPDLKPVSAWIGDVGLQGQGAAWSVGVTPFYTRVQNTIGKTNVETPDGLKVKRINLDGARIFGVESTLTVRPSDAFSLDGSLTWSRPRTFADGEAQKLDEKPGVMGTGMVRYELPGGVSVMGQARYTGNVYARLDDVTGRAFDTLPDAVILDARLAYNLARLTSGFAGEVYARADNLTDEVKFIGLGLPRAGRSFRVGVRVTL